MFHTVDNRPVITVGDKTSKGGVVLQGSPVCSLAGRPIARVGDKVSCPCNHCKGRGGWAYISTGTPNLRCDGKYAARDGDFTDCGGVLMAAGDAAHASAAPLIEAAVLARKLLSLFDRFFEVVDQHSGAPLGAIPYRIRLSDGREFVGVTDANGHTQKVQADISQSAEIEVPYYGESTNTIDTQGGHDACGC